jgi:hypothetical protein
VLPSIAPRLYDTTVNAGKMRPDNKTKEEKQSAKSGNRERQITGLFRKNRPVLNKWVMGPR